MQAMIFAAGRAERLGTLTDNQPAALLKVRGRPLIVWHVLNLVRAGVTDIVINHAWEGAQIEAALGDGSRYGARIAWSAEQTALGSAGGVAMARERGILQDAPFIGVSTDIYSPHFPFASLRDALEENDLWGNPLPASQRDLAWIYLVKNPPRHPAGDFALDSFAVRNRGEAMLTFSNVGIYRPELFAGIRAGERADLGQLLRGFAEQGLVGGDVFRGDWSKVDSAEEYARLNAPYSAPNSPGLPS